ncbi:dehydrodolichyl diphosphate synthase 2-like [Chenopodium quinoa]|uniref:Alkyl transferase n=1 Tax=Chenopodium quinoa TaxID=63459 RepID=A0A803MMU3_CHEQI|nr:dehydrodolichyl diphosphate synthase 2-like [Chenopodium quinoa]
MLRLVCVNGFSFLTSSKILVKSQAKNNLLLPKYNPNRFFRSNYILTNTSNNNNSVAPINCAQSREDLNQSSKEVNENSMARLQQGEFIIPKHVAITLDGCRRWHKARGLDLDYKSFFQANLRFVEYCLKWKVGTATSYIYGLRNFKLRSKEAVDFCMGQFETFLKEEMDNLKRKGVRVSIIGQKYVLSESCQATIKKVEEATKHNTKLDLVLPLCYTSQSDIVQATRKICHKVKKGSITLEDVNEDLIQQHLSACGSRPLPDLYIRTSGLLRIGMLLGWRVADVELYFIKTCAPDFGEDEFLDALRSYQQRTYRLFGS